MSSLNTQANLLVGLLVFHSIRMNCSCTGEDAVLKDLPGLLSSTSTTYLYMYQNVHISSWTSCLERHWRFILLPSLDNEFR